MRPSTIASKHDALDQKISLVNDMIKSCQRLKNLIEEAQIRRQTNETRRNKH